MMKPFFIVNKFKRFINDGYFLRQIIKLIKKPSSYFSYCIPVYSNIIMTNWFYVSNLIPAAPKFSRLALFSILQMHLLAYRIKKTKVLRNGVDREVLKNRKVEKEKVAITVGTQKYKNLKSLYLLFIQLKERKTVEKLKIIGDLTKILRNIGKDTDVKVMGILDHEKAIYKLAKSKVYLSSSKIENSSIASLRSLKVL